MNTVLSYDRRPARRATSASPTSNRFHLVDVYGLSLFVVLAYLGEQIALLRRLLTSDGWLTLLAGREIAKHGLPHHDTLTVISHGRRWVDQQWLAQVAFYAIDRVGGIPLVVTAGLILAVGSFAAAIVIGARRGVEPRTLVWVLVLALVPFGRSADNVRAQSLCYPLFLALILLLIEQERRPSKRAYLVLPLLVLWANLHGSVVLAALLVSACAIANRRNNGVLRTFVLTLGPWLCTVASPYARDLPHYYRLLLVNPAFGQYLVEWKAATVKGLDVFLFALVFIVAYLLGSGRSGWGRSERIILVICGLSALLAVRNGVWLSLAGLVFLPAALARVTSSSGPTVFARRANRILVGLAGLAVLAACVATATKRGDWFTAAFPATAADRAAAAAGSTGKIFATEDYGDWLLWRHPELAGRIAFDARLELLDRTTLRRAFDLENERNAELLRGYDVAVIPSSLATYIARAGRTKASYERNGVSVLESDQTR